jgi:succinate dehydrogenase / fumarate reductase cytochrome b subunit
LFKIMDMTATATIPTTRLRWLAWVTPFLLRRLHSLTGILFGFYVLFHLLINATLVEGYREAAPQTVYQTQVNFIHSIPFLPAAEWLFVFLPILFHSGYGLWLTYQAQPNVSQYPYGKNVFYVFQRITALLLAAFIFFHVTAMRGWWAASLKFNSGQATESVVAHMGLSWFIGWFVYPVGILAACYHLANGFWTAAISWGLTVTTGAQRRWGWVCLAVFVVTFVLGITALVAALGAAAGAHHG